MRKNTPTDPTVSPQSWASMKMDDNVTVFECHGHAYYAVAEVVTSDSSMIWTRRPDTNSRHLIERHDGIRIQPFARVSEAEPLPGNTLLLENLR